MDRSSDHNFFNVDDEINSILDDNIEIATLTKNKLEFQGEQIDNVDEELLNLLCERMNISEMVGKLKSDNGVTILKAARWREILRNRTQSGEEKGLSKAFVIKLLKAIHQESINRQASVMEPLN